MLENSKTGQVTGFLIKNWMPVDTDRMIVEPSGGIAGLEFCVNNLMGHNPKLLRAVLNAGPSIDSIPRLCRDFADADVKQVHLPEWFAADFLVQMDPQQYPFTLSICQTSVKKADGDINTRAAVYINRANKLSMDIASEDAGKAFWNSARLAFAKTGIEEFWNRITGQIKPSWGILDRRNAGSLYMSEVDYHYCFLTPERSKLPEGIDASDLTRLETFFEGLGLPTARFLKTGITKQYIITSISRLADISDSLEHMLASAEKTAE